MRHAQLHGRSRECSTPTELYHSFQVNAPLFQDLHPTRRWKSNPTTSRVLRPSHPMTAASILADITHVDAGAVNECRSPFIACQPLSLGTHETPGHPELGARTGLHLLGGLWNKGLSGCATPRPCWALQMTLSGRI